MLAITDSAYTAKCHLSTVPWNSEGARRNPLAFDLLGLRVFAASRETVFTPYFLSRYLGWSRTLFMMILIFRFSSSWARMSSLRSW